MLEKHFTIDEIAEAWGFSGETVRRIFRNEPGVLLLGEGSRRVGGKLRRRYFVMRVPQTVLDRVWSRLLQKRSARTAAGDTGARELHAG